MLHYGTYACKISVYVLAVIRCQWSKWFDLKESCCEDQIISNPEVGFEKGTNINVELNDCRNLVVSYANKNDFKISLTSWNEMNVSFQRIHIVFHTSFILSLTLRSKNVNKLSLFLEINEGKFLPIEFGNKYHSWRQND